ncbi:FKBP-type peptidyl-prolyl cis-trans isomerase [uncultured archaeon]|nr:FKBP-type peptidyl-prolyl cis-trans isomerase [uncultured archaeon]
MRDSDIMKKFAIFSLIALISGVILFSGCIDQRTAVKSGDTVSVDYILTSDGKIFDTSIESVAKENNIVKPAYGPLNFTVGKGMVIKGFDKGVIGMKVGESRTLTIPPEEGYGPVDPSAIQAFPIIQNLSATKNYSKIIEVPSSQFESTFGQGHKIGDTVLYPDTNIHFTIQNITSNVSLLFNQTVGYKIWFSGAPWNETIVKIDNKNFTTKPDVKKNEIIQLQGAPWNSTVIDVNDNITLKHNAIPDTSVPTMFGNIRVHFNETSVILDHNPELAGKTLIFNVTLRSINEGKK